MKLYIVHYLTDDNIFLLGAYDSIDKYKNAIAENMIQRKTIERTGTDQNNIKDFIEDNYIINELELNQDSNDYIYYY